MTTLLNAAAGLGFTTTSDGSGVVKLQSNGVATNSLAWGNFLGGSTPTINSTYNVSSVVYNSTGNWSVTLTNSLTSSNYAACPGNGNNAGFNNSAITVTSFTTSSFQISHFENNAFSNLAASIGNMYFSLFGT